MTDRHRILMLWGVPRSTSTAFEWMMRMRGDLICFHEPLGEAWYQGDDAQWPRRGPDTARQEGLTRQVALDRVLDAATKGPVFVKDFATYVSDIATPEFLGLFDHSFLIRDPAKVYTSYFKQTPVFDDREVGFDALRVLYDQVTEHCGYAPPVLDSDDLMEDPHRMVEVYCDAVDLTFLPDALSWESGGRDEVRWYDTDGTWHLNLMNSTGLEPQPKTSVDITEAPSWVQDLHDQARPHYDYLWDRRLTG